MRRRNGFSLIELLVVIAVIAILSAIIFPVYAQAKRSAYRSSDISNMNSLRTALQLYKTDNGTYPPALLGYVGPYSNRDASGANVLPPNAIKDALFPRRVDSLSVFRPALNRVSDNAPGVPYNVGNFPTTAGDSLVTGAYWPTSLQYGQGGTRSGPRQMFGPSVQVSRAVIDNNGCSVVPSFYYRISGYDVAPRTSAPGAPMESHYQLFWSGWTVPADPCNPTSASAGNVDDTPRQLGYSEPPEDTVVTWNSYFRDYVNGAPQHIKQDIVLFLGGNARPMDSATVAAQGWMTKP